MSVFNILKILLEQTEGRGDWQEINRKLTDKDMSIESLRRKKEQLSTQYMFFTMEHFTLEGILKHVEYRRSFQKDLESQLEQISNATMQLGHILERVEWHKILNYDHMLRSAELRENEQMRKEMLELYKTMESRLVVTEFRHEQRNKATIEVAFEKCKTAVNMQKNRLQAMFESALEKRNKVIVDLIIGSKKLKELRLKLQQKILQKESIQSFLGSISTDNVATVGETSEKQVENQVESSMEIDTEKLSPDTPGDIFLKTSFNIHFNEFDSEEFDLEKLELIPKKFKDFSFKDSSKDETESFNTPKKPRTECNEIDLDKPNSSLTPVNINVEDSVKEKIKVKDTDAMEVDIFYELRQQIRESGDLMQTDESINQGGNQKFEKSDQFTLDANKNIEKSNKSHENTLSFEDVNIELSNSLKKPKKVSFSKETLLETNDKSSPSQSERSESGSSSDMSDSPKQHVQKASNKSDLLDFLNDDPGNNSDFNYSHESDSSDTAFDKGKKEINLF